MIEPATSLYSPSAPPLSIRSNYSRPCSSRSVYCCRRCFDIAPPPAAGVAIRQCDIAHFQRVAPASTWNRRVESSPSSVIRFAPSITTMLPVVDRLLRWKRQSSPAPPQLKVIVPPPPVCAIASAASNSASPHGAATTAFPATTTPTGSSGTNASQQTNRHQQSPWSSHYAFPCSRIEFVTSV